ncbi:hypothetical protein ENUP19_0042G0052 [Entamoeba nuttalli]|uniref:Uncharacterized protein n=1 Tax=Entamoeba nuttalli TaxID=412467 RepID=A0ABQ0DAL7_9EUKA
MRLIIKESPLNASEFVLEFSSKTSKLVSVESITAINRLDSLKSSNNSKKIYTFHELYSLDKYSLGIKPKEDVFEICIGINIVLILILKCVS